MITPSVVFFVLVAIKPSPNLSWGHNYSLRGLTLINATILAISLATNALPRLTVHVDQPTISVSPALYGIFFEEINNAGDGGLYAELVRNRGFEDATAAAHWQVSTGARHRADADVVNIGQPQNNVLRLQDGTEQSWISNNGFWGMSVNAGATYRFQFKASTGMGAATAEVSLEGPTGEVLGTGKVVGIGEEWTQCSARIRVSKSEPKAKLVIRPRYSGTLWIDEVSLFPEATFKRRNNGMRPDLAAMLDDLKPAFMRFPGGCWVEGETCAGALRWKTTIGNVFNRRNQPNLWNYQSTNGLGYQEYLQLCEDIGADPLFVINCGMSHREVVPMAKMDEYVQDALDAIEYANGPATSEWGAKRALNGHPKPFGLKYLEIGNENGGEAYAERYPLFVEAIKANYPEIKLICNVWGGTPKSAPIEIVDEHYYSSPEFFIQNADKYDSYDRRGPKVYVGEYAVTQGSGNGNLRAALGEAAFMTGMERNSDVVVMSSYAPLFANVNAKNWNPDLIYFDSSRVCGTPSYYVQKMFSRNRPDTILKSELSEIAFKRGSFPPGGIGLGTWNTQSEFKDVKVIQGSKTLFESKTGEGFTSASGKWESSGGAYHQSSGAEPARAWAGDASWTNYTLTCKARKLGGTEGFLITVGRRDEQNYLWWNIGGWGNSLGAIEMAKNGAKSLIGKQAPSKVETGRWYDVRIDYSPDRIKCLLDGKVVYDEVFPAQKPIYFVSGKTKSGELIVKVVNVSDNPHELEISFDGADSLARSASIETLTSKDPAEENTVNNPRNVFPTFAKVSMSGNALRRTFPAHSLTVIRVKSAK